LLCACRKRPCCRNGNGLDEIAPSHCLPHGQDYANNVTLQQGFATSEMDSGVILRSSKSRSLMSALGQKRTCNQSAQCPLYPRKRTLELSCVMSALCHKRTHAPHKFREE
jgi:hypothetical protein